MDNRRERPNSSNLSGYFRSLRLDRDVVDGTPTSGTEHSTSLSRTPGASITDDYFQLITTQVRPQPQILQDSPALTPKPPSGERGASPQRGGGLIRIDAGATAGATSSFSTHNTSYSGLDASLTRRSPLSLLPPVRPEHRNRNTLVLDLDETLVHSSSCRSSHDPTNPNDMLLSIDIDGRQCEIFVKLRPHLMDFLAAVGEMFEVVIFTASLAKYAAPLISRLDPQARYCHHQLYRQHCTLYERSYVKDLTLLGRPLNKIIIVDNSPAAYLYQPRNAIPCTTWFDDLADTELKQFLPFLQLLSVSEDVYPMLDAYHELLRQHSEQ